MTEPAKDPLHAITLKEVVEKLVDHYGWEDLAAKINIKCFKIDPSVKSSLTFLRKTPWARQQVERLYISSVALGSTPWVRAVKDPSSGSS